MTSTDRVRYLTTVVGSFHGRVVAARLGAEGILVHLKGVDDGLYPAQGAVEIYVHAAQLDLAREILLGDAVDDAYDSMTDPEKGIVSFDAQDELSGALAGEVLARTGALDEDLSADGGEAFDELSVTSMPTPSARSHSPSRGFHPATTAVAVGLVAVLLIVWIVAATR